MEQGQGGQIQAKCFHGYQETEAPAEWQSEKQAALKSTPPGAKRFSFSPAWDFR